ncbi:MAG: sulfite exporter TauE/SafE family protein [Clostridiales bacterium]|nr:sulfite exporter TauE/SafE family protein [Clostridiales bacterium]
MIEFSALLITTVFAAFIHTLVGVDHYVPFVALSRANDWAVRKTLLVVFICGLGHVLSSILLGLIGIALASELTQLTGIEDIRGEIATYFLIAFGLVYTTYGIRRSVKNQTHRHTLPDGSTIMHAHSESGEEHEHIAKKGKKSTNLFWGLFILFVLGPCEPLIPLMIHPEATRTTPALVAITATFAVCTIATMLLMTFLGLKGVRLLKLNKLERHMHTMAGSAVLLCGIALLVLEILLPSA